jgi:hypothetical protein
VARKKSTSASSDFLLCFDSSLVRRTPFGSPCFPGAYFLILFLICCLDFLISCIVNLACPAGLWGVRRWFLTAADVCPVLCRGSCRGVRGQGVFQFVCTFVLHTGVFLPAPRVLHTSILPALRGCCPFAGGPDRCGRVSRACPVAVAADCAGLLPWGARFLSGDFGWVNDTSSSRRTSGRTEANWRSRHIVLLSAGRYQRLRPGPSWSALLQKFSRHRNRASAANSCTNRFVYICTILQ